VILRANLPIVLKSEVGSFGGLGRFGGPIAIVPYEEIEPDGPRQPHQRGLQHQEQEAVHAHPPEQPVVVERHPDQHFPRDERCDADGNGQGVAYEARAIPESYLYLEGLTADGAGLIHLHKPFQVICIAIDEEMAPAATRAPVAQDAYDEAGFVRGIVVVGSVGTHMITFLLPQSYRGFGTSRLS